MQRLGCIGRECTTELASRERRQNWKKKKKKKLEAKLSGEQTRRRLEMTDSPLSPSVTIKQRENKSATSRLPDQ